MPILRLGLIAFAFLMLFPCGCGDTIEPGNKKRAEVPLAKVKVAVARTTLQPLTYEAVGTVQPVTTSTLASKLMGTVKEIRVQEGDRVQQGQTLVVVDKRNVTAQLRQAQAALDEARRAEAAAVSARDAAVAGAQLARATYERYLRLIQEDSASRQEFDEVEARHRQAQASLKQAEQMLAAARYRVQQAEAGVSAAGVATDDAAILAPYDGIVTAKMSEVGDLATPGTPFLALESTEGYRVDVVLPEAFFSAIRLQQTVMVRIPALGDQSLEGRVETIVPAADQSSRSFLVKIRLPADGAVRSGMFARVVIRTGEERMMLIPVSAVVPQGQLTGIFIVDDNQITRFRLIRTGRRLGDTTEIITGLDEGQRFVLKPPPALVDGARVEALP
ncbi:MAG: efflux RND transporter periplasmic adaptor subunit [Desulfobacterales bacterium]|nr:MAG: efflux RND transporter periplasmic adaptor subunit [Desulfobacterales bacterium]